MTMLPIGGASAASPPSAKILPLVFFFFLCSRFVDCFVVVVALAKSSRRMIPPPDGGPAKQRYVPTRQVLPAIIVTSRRLRLCRRWSRCLSAEKTDDDCRPPAIISCACFDLLARERLQKISNADRVALILTS